VKSHAEPSVSAPASFTPSAQTATAAAGPTSNSSPSRSSATKPLTPYCEVLAETILYLARERGYSFSAAAEEVGISFRSLCRWRLQHCEFNLHLLNARRAYRTARLGIIQEAKLKDGRPDWRAAAWEMEHAHPEDYSLNPKRRAAFAQMRQDELEEWEYLQAVHDAEKAGRPAPISQKFQKSPAPPTPASPHPAAPTQPTTRPAEKRRHSLFDWGHDLTDPLLIDIAREQNITVEQAAAQVRRGVAAFH
jgi:transposase-like protein